jgi:hypothetical protein
MVAADAPPPPPYVAPAMPARRIDPHDEPISAVLRRVLSEGDEQISVHELADAFGSRAFGAILFVFSVPNLLPLPPGSSTVLGAPLVIIAPQVALGMEHPWIPRWLGRRTVSRAKLKGAFDRLLPKLERLERVMRPRGGVLFSRLGDRLIGLVCFLLALVLILPIPFGNLLPAAAVAALSLGLATRDGIAAALGYALAGVSVLVLALTANVVVAAARSLLHIFAI